MRNISYRLPSRRTQTMMGLSKKSRLFRQSRWLLIIMLLANAFFYCGKGSGSSAESQSALTNKTINAEESQIYFSAANPGKWKDYKQDHELLVNVSKDGETRLVTIEVPFKPDTDHYIEVIVLVDEQNREIAKQRFERGEKAVATFSIPPNTKGGIFAVAKCNLHDMWKTKVD